MRTTLPRNFSASVEAVAIGASAGGIDALFTLLGGLQAPFRGSVMIVLHLPEDHESRLVEVFASRLAIDVQEAQPGAPVGSGKLYFAPPGYHLLVEADRTFALSCDPPVLFSRPSIDVLMESCADAYGGEVAGLVLTGANEDGARGLAAIKARGGMTAVQDPQEAQHATMPQAAIAAADPDFVLPLAGLRSLLQTVVR
ncbi:chemotaxis protein CheB [Ramlibacter sp. XY19]|uniref:chemotaxis protein CheB n=1 Tax=Ramlibacter paludis TaxID=2908000 RepID=UPI0023DB4B74|nr:chemotaxis protein CheB [Ramlibacter paludis]MCG2594305.1 chemotaxis protein CheB [Ramlibacter paludis]